jgi:ribonuclease Z
MAARELYVLGTASQVPTRYRNHNAYFLRWDDEGILFDPGEGTQRQLTFAGLSAHAITRICITHFHGDHCLGLPGIIQRLSLEACPEVTVYYPASGQRYFENLRNASIYARLEKLVTVPVSAGGVLFETDSFAFEAAALDHDVECYGYRIRERDKLGVREELLKPTGVKGRQIGDLLRDGKVVAPDGTVVLREDVTEMREGQSFAFIMDTRRCPGAEQLAAGVDLLVCESTFLSSETELAGIAKHMTARQAAELARDARAKRLVLTHFSQRYDDPNAFLEEAREVHQDSVVALDPDMADPKSTRHRIAVPKRVKV